MADPATLTLVGAGIGALGSAVGTFAEVSALKGQEKLARMEAESAREAAGIKERQYRGQAERVLAKQHAIAGASGVVTSSGSPLEIALDSARQAELDALNIRYGGEMTARAKEFEAKLHRRRIPFTIFGGAAKAGSSILGGMYKGGYFGSSQKVDTSAHPQFGVDISEDY